MHENKNAPSKERVSAPSIGKQYYLTTTVYSGYISS